MNKARRESLQIISEQLSNLRDALEILSEEEWEYMENTPENLRGSERYEIAESVCADLGEAVENVEFAIGHIEAATE